MGPWYIVHGYMIQLVLWYMGTLYNVHDTLIHGSVDCVVIMAGGIIICVPCHVACCYRPACH